MSSFSTLLTQIIPLALGAAVSPTALMGIILLLSISKRPKLQGFGYYIGAVILILMVIITWNYTGSRSNIDISQNPIHFLQRSMCC